MIVGSLMISYGSVYAEEVTFPTFTTDGLTGMDVQTFYPSNSTYTVQIVLQYHVEHPLEIPETVTWFGIDSILHEIKLQDEFNLAHFPAEEVAEDTKKQDELDRIDAILDEKKLELVEATPELDKYRLCLEEFKTESPVKFQAWERIGSLTEFELTYQQTYADHPTVAETNANKKHQECEVRKSYPFVGVWEANKELDGLSEPIVTDMTSESEGVTAEDIKAQESIAEKFQCSDEGKSRGLCLDYMSGDKYVKPEPNLEDWYGYYQNVKNTSTDIQEELDRLKKVQCDNYFHLYNATSAIEVPQFLSNCPEILGQ